MAHFRVTCRGGRGQASRLGSKGSGATTSCNGWDLGATCWAEAREGQSDMISVELDSGSAQSSKSYGHVYLYKDDEGFPAIELGLGAAKHLVLNEDFINRLLEHPEQVKRLRGLLFVNGMVSDATP